MILSLSELTSRLYGVTPRHMAMEKQRAVSLPSGSSVRSRRFDIHL